MRIKAINDEAERLVREHGTGAAAIALKAMARARRSRNLRMEQYMGKVAVAAARIAVDPAPRLSPPRS